MSTRFSSADTAWLHMDRPTNLMVINSVLLFDEPVDWDRVKQITQRRIIDVYPRFSQRVVESRLPLRPPKWVDDSDFALEHHLHHRALPAPGDRAALQELVSDLMTMPLDRSRPLWHTYMVDGYGDGAAIISRMHHCIADGIALGRVMGSLSDKRPDADIGPPPAALEPRRANGPFGELADSATQLAVGAGQLVAATARQTAAVATSPSHASPAPWVAMRRPRSAWC